MGENLSEGSKRLAIQKIISGIREAEASLKTMDTLSKMEDPEALAPYDKFFPALKGVASDLAIELEFSKKKAKKAKSKDKVGGAESEEEEVGGGAAAAALAAKAKAAPAARPRVPHCFHWVTAKPIDGKLPDQPCPEGGA